jgi:acyl-CoA thioesterase-1
MVMNRWFLLLWLLLAAPSHAAEPVILVLGDSLSAAYGIRQEAGWVNLLQQRLMREGHPHRVVNASISGDTTAGGLDRLPMALESHKPAILIIELGGNDGLRGINFRQTRDHLERMVRLGLKENARVILLGMMLPPNFGRAYTEKFLDIYREVAAGTSVPLVPFFLEGVADRPEWMQQDGIHPTGQGQPTMLEHVWAVLDPMLAGQSDSSSK